MCVMCLSIMYNSDIGLFDRFLRECGAFGVFEEGWCGTWASLKIVVHYFEDGGVVL